MTEAQAAEWISEHMTALYGYAFARLYNKSDVDDLVSEIICALLSSARRLRADDGQVRLAFATSSNDFASESYEVGACYYLRKPFRPEGVRAMLERLDLEALERSRRLRLPDGSQVVLRSIRYAASDGHRVTLHCKDGDRTLRTSFAAVEPLLCAYPCFCGICRGVVVNFHEVAGRQEDVFLLKDGTRLPISRRRLREVQEAYSAFRFDRLRKDGVD